jgi:MFS transporter, DHA1 family, tetracycline resistance protein
MRKPSLLVVFLTVFVDLVGFGIVLPLLPIFSRDFGASGVVIGLITASFSAMQFLFAPSWGRLSDRIGRRPVLLVSTAGSVLSYSVFALGASLANHSAALWVLFLSRLLAGICGANITVAQAYIADVTPAADRSKRMGLIGVAFGLGFILGPAIGAVSLKWLGMTGPGWIAAGLCAVNFIFALTALPESLQPSSEHAGERPRLASWRETLQRPGIGLLVGIHFLSTFCFTCFETTLGLLIMRNFQLDLEHDTHAQATVGYLFAYCGIIGALVQGGMIGRLVKRLGEPRLIRVSLVITAVGMVPLPFLTASAQLSWHALAGAEGVPWLGLLVFLAVLSFGSALTRAPLFGLLSNLTPPQQQGVTIGVAQSLGSLARIVGPVFAASLFYPRPWIPYSVCGALLLAGSVWFAGAWQPARPRA